MPNTQLEKLKDITPVVLSITDDGIAKLREEYGNLDATTPKEFTELKAGIAVYRNTRKAVDDKKDELKKPLISMGRSIDVEYKRVISLLEKDEEVLKKRKEAYEAEQGRKKKEKEEAEAKRIKTIEDRINAFFANTRGLVGKSSAELKEKLQFFISCTEADDFDYQEFSIKADDVKRSVLAELEEAYKAKVEQENKDAEIEKERLEAERVAKFNYLLSLIKIASDKYLVAWQTCLISDMESAIKNLMEFDYSDYEEFKEDAETARAESIKTLNELIEKRKVCDSEQSELAELRANKAEAKRKELEAKQEEDKKIAEGKFNAVVADADKVFEYEGKLNKISTTVGTYKGEPCIKPDFSEATAHGTTAPENDDNYVVTKQQMLRIFQHIENFDKLDPDDWSSICELFADLGIPASFVVKKINSINGFNDSMERQQNLRSNNYE